MDSRFVRFSNGISAIHRYLRKIEADEMAKYGLKGPHALYLAAMYHRPDGITPVELGKLCNRNKADVSRAIASMRARGLVEKETDTENKYRVPIRLTEAGYQAAQTVRLRAQQAAEIGGKGMSETQREAFYSALELIAGNLQAISEDGIPQNDLSESD